ncbi:MAG: 3-deoxy-7-phosphoheptulonate synthase [Treponema sp.]|nr:3-deoxy-7-phosphoheptulonate synthase [Treponema sp.]
MEYIKKLLSVEEVRNLYPLSKKLQEMRRERISEIQDILTGKNFRKLLIIGPCSADREDAVLDYCTRLAKVAEDVKEKILIIPRIYTSKPRTKGNGYKGMLHRPHPESAHDELEEGIIASRKMHLHVIEETGLFSADEMLYPDTFAYFSDLICYAAVGARSVEDQGHRLTASGLEIPVGMKNPMDGSISVLLNSIEATQSEQSFVYREWIVNTNGNPYAHAILRGYVDKTGKAYPNYHYEDVCALHDMYKKTSLKNIGVIIDCNHSNSNKNADMQIRIAKEIKELCKDDISVDSFVKGLMIESYLEDGNQIVGGGVYGKSITDACIGWEKTRKLIENFIL